MSFWTRARDFVEDAVTSSIGGSAVFGVLGGVAGPTTTGKLNDALKTIGTGVIGAAFTSKLTSAGLPAFSSSVFRQTPPPPPPALRVGAPVRFVAAPRPAPAAPPRSSARYRAFFL